MISVSFSVSRVKATYNEDNVKAMRDDDRFLSATQLLNGQALRIDHIGAVLLRAKIDRPVKTSFGVMRERPALIVEMTERSGCTGYGEIWCNFPSYGAEYKAHLLVNEFAAALAGFAFSDPFQLYRFLQSKFEILALQCGDRGALSQIIAGIDQAAWDCFGRLAGKSISQIFGADGHFIPAYASGIHPADVEEIVPKALEAGYQAAKVKVGFSQKTDAEGLWRARHLLGEGRRLMADANQGWRSVEQALDAVNRLGDCALDWIEEALPADRKEEEWKALKSGTEIPLAGGENLPTTARLARFHAAKIFDFIQPDIGKIGGFSGLLNIFSGRLKQGVVYCPHWLGGGLGLAASAHLLNIIGGSGLLEVDMNENPLRDQMGIWQAVPDISGKVAVPSAAGIGLIPDYSQLQQAGIKITRLG